MLTSEKIERKVADDEEKWANGSNRRKGKELMRRDDEKLVLDERRMVSKEMVSTKSIRKVCSLRRTSKYGIDRSSVNAAITKIIR